MLAYGISMWVLLPTHGWIEYVVKRKSNTTGKVKILMAYTISITEKTAREKKGKKENRKSNEWKNEPGHNRLLKSRTKITYYEKNEAFEKNSNSNGSAATTKEKRKHFTKENAMECYLKKQARGIFKTLSLGKQLARNTLEKELLLLVHISSIV